MFASSAFLMAVQWFWGQAYGAPAEVCWAGLESAYREKKKKKEIDCLWLSSAM